jgi:hypothetical protein
MQSLRNGMFEQKTFTRRRLWLGSALAVGGCVAVCSIPIFLGVIGVGMASSLMCTPEEALVAAGLCGVIAASLFAVRQRFSPSRCRCSSKTSASVGRDAPIACDLSVFGQSERVEHMALARSLWKQAKQIIEHKDGFTFVFEAMPILENQVAHWVNDERKCCPFFSFEVVHERESSTLRLRITGPDGAKEILAIELKSMNLLT